MKLFLVIILLIGTALAAPSLAPGALVLIAITLLITASAEGIGMAKDAHPDTQPPQGLHESDAHYKARQEAGALIWWAPLAGCAVIVPFVILIFGFLLSLAMGKLP